MGSYLSTSVVLVCLIGAFLAGCAGDEAQPLVTMELDCQATIDLIDTPPDDYETAREAISLPGPATVHEIGQIDEVSGLGFAKSGLLVRAGIGSTITVTAPEQRIGWGTTETAQRIIIPACVGPAEWLVYAGGFYVPEPACMTLTVEVEGGSTDMRFPIDAPCP